MGGLDAAGIDDGKRANSFTESRLKFREKRKLQIGRESEVGFNGLGTIFGCIWKAVW